ncbi:MAG: Glu/Leu/Phe/Val dehydrogenase [Pseudomonadales bacterium]|nr:Glu/Leu/Phe/Val dehydrogenase [Pseudomonadales bacterium]NIX09247.1 Glu/Leu/Phe/Val dehydrogenase [Pseudomonadales bacterium]
MSATFDNVDDLGPEKVIEIYDPSTSLRAIVVVDNIAAGPAIGGVRMAVDATREECARLARAMTLKNAMAGLAHGGAKSVIIADPAMTAEAKEVLIRSFAHAITDLRDYIPGPDMGTDESSMALVRDVTGRSAGLPREVGGIPLDEIGATGLGLSVSLEVAEAFADITLNGARVVVQGFGSVGQHAARYLARRGARLVGVSDSRGARAAADGFDLDLLLTAKHQGISVGAFDEGEAIDPDDLVALDCDVWIPAARPDVLDGENADQVRAKVVAQGANIPATPEAEQIMAARGILVIPDFVANAGGVICAAVEYHGGSESQAMATIRDKIHDNVKEVLSRATTTGDLPRKVAMDIAHERVHAAMRYRKTY